MNPRSLCPGLDQSQNRTKFFKRISRAVIGPYVKRRDELNTVRKLIHPFFFSLRFVGLKRRFENSYNK